MKNVAMITLLVSAFAFTAFGQQQRERRQPRSSEEIAKMRTEQLTKSLSLTEEQQKEVYTLNFERAEKMKAAREDQSARGADMREEMKADRERLEKILTPEQRETLKKQEADRRAKFNERRGENGNRAGNFRRGDRTRSRTQ